MNARAGELSNRRRAPAVDVAVVGGGMVGAAAALALARAGFRVALLEARAPGGWSAQDELDLRVVGLAPSSLVLLDDLAVWTSIREARVGPYSHMHVWDAESGAAIDFDAARERRDRLGYIVENALVQWMLWQALDAAQGRGSAAGAGSAGAAAAGVRRLCPAEVRGFEAREDRIQLELADGETLTAALLVAADGAASLEAGAAAEDDGAAAAEDAAGAASLLAGADEAAGAAAEDDASAGAEEAAGAAGAAAGAGKGLGEWLSVDRYAMMLARSLARASPAYDILVPGAYFFGLVMKSLRSSNVHLPPLLLSASE